MLIISHPHLSSACENGTSASDPGQSMLDLWYMFFYEYLDFTLSSFISPLLRTHIPFIYHGSYIILAVESVVKKTFFFPPPLPFFFHDYPSSNCWRVLIIKFVVELFSLN